MVGERDAAVVPAVDAVVVEPKARIRKQHITPKKSGKSYHMKRGIGFGKSVTERANKEGPSAVFYPFIFYRSCMRCIPLQRRFV